MAYYLKHRPQKIKDLDLKFVRDSLSEILQKSEAPHAFLFVGPKGTGKTSSARIIAKSVNCLSKKKNSGEPCGKCEICKQITSGQLMDLIEIDAASNRGIDDIRDLKSKINLTPSLAKIKVYIIDEVHMLTTEAFNALLKTLEEPPKHAMFVLCTTEPAKLPETIVSRCLTIQFQKASIKEVVRSLTRVAKLEKISITTKDLEVLAKKANGSFRDAVKILEQLANVSKKVSSKRVVEVLSRGIGEKNIDDWLSLIVNQKTKEALDWLSQAIDSGVDVRQLGIDAVDRLRQIIMIEVGVETGDNPFKDQGLEKLKLLTFSFHQAIREIKGAVIESLPVELMIIEWSKSDQGDDSKDSEKPDEKKQDAKETSSKVKLNNKSGKLSLKTIESKWSKVLETIRPHNHSLEALLKATKPSGFEGKYLVLEVFYKFHKERLENERYKLMIEKIISEVLDAPVNIRYVLGLKQKKVIKENKEIDNLSGKIDNDIIKTAEEVFGVEVS